MFMTSSTNINEVMTFISDRVPAGADAILDVQRSPCSVNRKSLVVLSHYMDETSIRMNLCFAGTDKEKLWQLQYPDDKKCSRIFVFITPYETYEKPNGELVSRHWAIIHNLNAMQQEQIKSVWTEAEKGMCKTTTHTHKSSQSLTSRVLPAFHFVGHLKKTRCHGSRF